MFRINVVLPNRKICYEQYDLPIIVIIVLHYVLVLQTKLPNETFVYF